MSFVSLQRSSPTSTAIPNSNATASSAQFHVYDDAFLSVIGNTPTLSIALNSSNSSFPQFHEAAVVTCNNLPTLLITSNQYNFTGIDSPSTNNKVVSISKVTLDTNSQTWSSEIIGPVGPTIFLANGGSVLNPNSNISVYLSSSDNTSINDTASSPILLLGQGSLTDPGGIHLLSPDAHYTTRTLLYHYHGTPFNSPNDVVQHLDGSIWFTDPGFGFIQSIRPTPLLQPSIYRYDPITGDLRVVVDSLAAPNGIAFSRDEKTVYITDTGRNSSALDGTRGIYAFTVSGTAVSIKRVFAISGSDIADGIKTDKAGNVYAGCGDGVNVWDVDGKLLGKVVVEGGAANFALLEGRMVILGETRLWKAGLEGMSI